MSTSNKTPRRIKNYMFVREKKNDDLEWIRAERVVSDNMPRPIVLCNGVFDLLHPGHLRILFQARDLGKTLIVAMDSDRRVKELKGPLRPIMNWVERATYLQYMPIDLLCEIDSDEEMNELIQRVRPDIRVQGAEYLATRSRYPWLRKAYVRMGNIKTSDIINRIIERYNNETP